MIMPLFVVVLLRLLLIVQSSDNSRNATEKESQNTSDITLNIDGQLIALARTDHHSWRFDPSDSDGGDQYEDDDDNDEFYNTSSAAENETDYTALFHRLLRRSRDDDDDARGTTCMDNLQKFRMLAKNRPLQFVVVVEEGGEARLTCHFCEDGDKIRESKEWDEQEAAEGKPLWRNPASIRSPILWYRIRHFGTKRAFRMNEVKPSLHDDDKANRIYVTTGHTLVINNAEPDDGGTYFCRDTRTEDRLIKPVIKDWEIRDMMGDKGAFRFLIHLDVLYKPDIAARLVPSARKNVEKKGDYNIQLVTTWGRWGHCSMCDQTGEQKRRGVCTVKKLNQDDRSKPWYVNAVLTAQATGVPCRSSLFHTQYGDIRKNKVFFRPDEFMRRRCFISCHRKGFFKQLLSKKALSPSALKSIFSKEMKRKVKPKTLHETVGTTIELECPGASLDKVVMWMNESRYMPGVTLANVTEGRVSVDINGTLHISPLTIWDCGLYLCVVGDKETGHVYLNVTDNVEDEYTRYGRWVVLSIPVDFAVFLFLMIVKHRHRKRILISSEDAGGADDDDSKDDDNNSNVNASSCARSTFSPRSSTDKASSPTLSLASGAERNLNINSISRSSSSSSFSSSSGSSSINGSSFRSYASRGSYGYPSQTSI